MTPSTSHKRKILVNAAAKKHLRNSSSSNILKVSDKSNTINSSTQRSAKKISSMLSLKNGDESSKLSDSTNFSVNKSKISSKHQKTKKIMPKLVDEEEKSEIKIDTAPTNHKMELNNLDAKIKELTDQLDKLKSNQFDPSEFSNEHDLLELESSENLQRINFFLDKQIKEIEKQFEDETQKATQEYYDKRSELKESLKLEHEEMRKKIADIADLNIDFNETLLLISSAKRKLRSRCNNLNSNLNIDHLLDVNSLF
jgi:hypothetical protein